MTVDSVTSSANPPSSLTAQSHTPTSLGNGNFLSLLFESNATFGQALSADENTLLLKQNPPLPTPAPSPKTPPAAPPASSQPSTIAAQASSPAQPSSPGPSPSSPPLATAPSHQDDNGAAESTQSTPTALPQKSVAVPSAPATTAKPVALAKPTNTGKPSDATNSDANPSAATTANDPTVAASTVNAAIQTSSPLPAPVSAPPRGEAKTITAVPTTAPIGTIPDSKPGSAAPGVTPDALETTAAPATTTPLTTSAPIPSPSASGAQGNANPATAIAASTSATNAAANAAPAAPAIATLAQNSAPPQAPPAGLAAQTAALTALAGQTAGNVQISSGGTKPGIAGTGTATISSTAASTPSATILGASGSNGNSNTDNSSNNNAGGNGSAPGADQAAATAASSAAPTTNGASSAPDTTTSAATGIADGQQAQVALGLLGNQPLPQQVPITAQGVGEVAAVVEGPPGTDPRTSAIEAATGGNALVGEAVPAAVSFADLLPTEAPSAANASPQPPAAANPAEQIKVQLSKSLKDGSDTINVILHPEELGTVEVKLQLQDGQVKATITADNPNTLALLKGDAHQLQQSLQSAGLSTDSNSLTFQMRGDQQHNGAFAQQGQNSGQNGQNQMSQNGNSPGNYGAETEQDDAPAAALLATGQNNSGLDISV